MFNKFNVSILMKNIAHHLNDSIYIQIKMFTFIFNKTNDTTHVTVVIFFAVFEQVVF